MSKKNLNKILLDSAEAVSYNVESSAVFLAEEGVNFDQYLCKGLEELDLDSNTDKIDSNELSKSQSYFRRAVLAAKIADEYHNEWTFGVVKFQKLVYLAEQTSEMKFAADYRKQAAGPMDHKFIHSIKKEFEKQGWFTVHQEGQYRKWVFKPQENVVGYQSYYSKYFSNVNEDIQFLIDSFRKWKTDKVELIATLFACWLEAKEDNALINDALLKQRVYDWHKAKKKFSEKDIIESIRWMEDNGVYPS